MAIMQPLCLDGDLMKRVTYLAALILMGLAWTSETASAQSLPEHSGDVLQILIPAAALGATLAIDDDEGRNQFTKTFLATLGVTYGLKLSIDKSRPDGMGSQSFPSGHTSAAFSAAAFIQQRYGWRYGLPAYAAAAFTGYSRVFADRHFVEDVIAGAAIGIISASIFTTSYERIAVTPVANSNAWGLYLSLRW
jgi:membrane-associated phospholipid phosphatase